MQRNYKSKNYYGSYLLKIINNISKEPAFLLIKKVLVYLSLILTLITIFTNMEPLQSIHNIMLVSYATASTLSYFYMDRVNLWLLQKLIHRLDNPDEILKALESESIICLKSKLNTSDEPIEIITAEIDESLNNEDVGKASENNSNYYKYVLYGVISALVLGVVIYYRNGIGSTLFGEDFDLGNGDTKELGKELTKILVDQYGEESAKHFVYRQDPLDFREHWSKMSYYERFKLVLNRIRGIPDDRTIYIESTLRLRLHDFASLTDQECIELFNKHPNRRNKAYLQSVLEQRYKCGIELEEFKGHTSEKHSGRVVKMKGVIGFNKTSGIDIDFDNKSDSSSDSSLDTDTYFRKSERARGSGSSGGLLPAVEIDTDKVDTSTSKGKGRENPLLSKMNVAGNGNEDQYIPLTAQRLDRRLNMINYQLSLSSLTETMKDNIELHFYNEMKKNGFVESDFYKDSKGVLHVHKTSLKRKGLFESLNALNTDLNSVAEEVKSLNSNIDNASKNIDSPVDPSLVELEKPILNRDDLKDLSLKDFVHKMNSEGLVKKHKEQYLMRFLLGEYGLTDKDWVYHVNQKGEWKIAIKGHVYDRIDIWNTYINPPISNLSQSVDGNIINTPSPLTSKTHSPASSTASLDVSNLPEISVEGLKPLEIPLPPSNPNSPYVPTTSLDGNPSTPPKSESFINDNDQTPKASSSDFQDSKPESSRKAMKGKKVTFDESSIKKNNLPPPSIINSLEEIEEYGIQKNDKENLRRFDEAIQKIGNPYSKERLKIMKERVEFTKNRYENAKSNFKNNYKIYLDRLSKE